jgi:hypothetical protein
LLHVGLELQLARRTLHRVRRALRLESFFIRRTPLLKNLRRAIHCNRLILLLSYDCSNYDSIYLKILNSKRFQMV